MYTSKWLDKLEAGFGHLQTLIVATLMLATIPVIVGIMLMPIIGQIGFLVAVTYTTEENMDVWRFTKKYPYMTKFIVLSALGVLTYIHMMGGIFAYAMFIKGVLTWAGLKS